MLRITAYVLMGFILFAACDERGAVAGDPPEESAAEPVLVKEATAKKILERAIVSMGGDAALAKITSAKLSYQGVYISKGMKSPFTSEMIFAQPDRLLWTLDAGMYKGAVGSAGGVSWTRFMAPVGRTKGPASESIAEWPNHQDMMLVRPLLHRDDVSLHLGDATDTDAGKEETVKVGFGGKQEFAATFLTKDGKTFLARIDGPQTHMDGRKGTMKFKLSVPKAFGEITLPTEYDSEAIVDGLLDHSMEEKLIAVEWNPKVPDTAFRMPKLTMEVGKVTEKKTESIYGLVVVHEGAHSRLGETFVRAFGLAAKAGLMFQPMATCVFMNDPATVDDPADLRTEVIVPLMVMGPPPKAPEGAEVRAIPALNVISMVVRGPYGLQEAEVVTKLTVWAGDNERKLSGRPRAVYFHNPSLVVDEDQVAEIQIPIK